MTIVGLFLEQEANHVHSWNDHQKILTADRQIRRKSYNPTPGPTPGPTPDPTNPALQCDECHTRDP